MTLSGKPTSAETTVLSPSCDSCRGPSMEGEAVAMEQNLTRRSESQQSSKRPHSRSHKKRHIIKQSRSTHESDTRH
eukprot:3492820-Prymnesium_polylepis.1